VLWLRTATNKSKIIKRSFGLQSWSARRRKKNKNAEDRRRSPLANERKKEKRRNNEKLKKLNYWKKRWNAKQPKRGKKSAGRMRKEKD
jgi:hypothetical protein